MTELPGLAGEIIVVDNNSTDGTAALTRKLDCKVVHESFRQISRARNAGARASLGKTLFFVDADTEVREQTVRLALEMIMNEKVGGGGAILEFDDDCGRWIAGRLLPYLWNLLSLKFSLFAGSFIFCRRDLFFQCGGFPETHFAGEEIVFNRSLKQACSRAGLQLKIISKYPVRSSARKLNWYNNWSMAMKLLPLFGFPWLLRSRKACNFWYDRPDGTS